MAWKRGTQNNQAGPIRLGHIKEFLNPSSRDCSASFNMKVIDAQSLRSRLGSSSSESLYRTFTKGHPYGAMNFQHLPSEVINLVDPDSDILYIHAHHHPTSVLACVHSECVPVDCIALDEIHRVNSKVCIGENQEFTVYQGDTFTYDAREGSVGDTAVRPKGPPAGVQNLVLDIRLRSQPECPPDPLDARLLRPHLTRYFESVVITTDEVYNLELHNGFPNTDDATSLLAMELVCTVSSLTLCRKEVSDVDGDTDADKDEGLDDNYRGLCRRDTAVYLRADNDACIRIDNNPNVPPSRALRNAVLIATCDDEVFPVQRSLLRPCIALTKVVQQGRGKYAQAECDGRDTTGTTGNGNEGANTEVECADVRVNVEACTFDRVLLYLEHIMRNEEFNFDPLLAPELREAAVTLGVQGLVDLCDKVLGSFTERVRRSYIRYDEIVARNTSQRPSGSKGETLLLLDGMVLDVTRWLDEHPGGSTIIPEQALNVDCTVFFEIYHASKQSFLYLKEFYLGEVDPQDKHRIPYPNPNGPAGFVSAGSTGSGDIDGGVVRASDAFMEQLRRVTPWRLKDSDMIALEAVTYKSF